MPGDVRGYRRNFANFSAARFSRRSRYASCRQAAEQNLLVRAGRPVRTAPQAAQRRAGAFFTVTPWEKAPLRWGVRHELIMVVLAFQGLDERHDRLCSCYSERIALSVHLPDTVSEMG